MGILREFRYELSALLFGLGLLGMFLAVGDYVFYAQSPDWLQSLYAGIGNFMFWVGVLAFFSVLIGGYYFIDTIRKDREFDRLLDTTSKEMFVKNLRRIEQLAYYELPSAYERRLDAKKKEFRIKT